jgi:DNA-directed RNA polymerase subunit beta
MKDDDFEFDRAAEELGINLSRNENLTADNEYTGF